MPEGEWINVTFERGLNNFAPRSVLEDGECQELKNLDWLPNGGVISRPGWKAAGGSPTGEPTQKRGRGIFTDWYESGVRKLVVATYDNATGFYLHKTNIADPTAFGSYSSIEGPVTITAGYYSDPVAFAVGAGVLMYTQPGFPNARLRVYNGATVTELATDGLSGGSLSNIAGRAIVFHLDRFWVGGSVAQPTYVRFTEIGDYDAWNTDENYIPVGKDDGEFVESIVIWDRGLVIGKQHSLWFLSGRTVDSFALDPITTRVGCARGPSSLIATEDGVFILGIDGNTYLWDGAKVNRLTDKVFVQTQPASGYMAGAFVGDKLFVSATGSGDTVWIWSGGRWRKEVLSDPSHYVQDLAVYDDRYLLASAVNGTRLLSVRQEVGPFAVGSYRDPSRDVGVSESFEVKSREWWPKGPLGKADLRSAYIRYRQWNAGASEKLTVTPVVDGVDVSAQAKVIGGKAAAGVYAERVDFAATVSGTNVALKITSAPTNTEDQTYSIEECWVHILRDAGRR
jgi:hypothetical protein